MNNFIYTKQVETYNALLNLGFADAGYFESNGNVTYVLIDPNGNLTIPKEYKASCIRNSAMFMSPQKGGEQNGGRIKKA